METTPYTKKSTKAIKIINIILSITVVILLLILLTLLFIVSPKIVNGISIIKMVAKATAKSLLT